MNLQMPHNLTIDDIRGVLRQHNALLVHFSSIPNMENFNLWFPDDLRGAINGNAQAAGGLSCSAIRPGDLFWGGNANSFGCIGIIVDLLHAGSLLDVTLGDGGSRIEGGRRQVMGRPFDKKMLEASLQRPSTTHNEWVVANYQVRGIFVGPPYFVAVRNGGHVPVNLQQVVTAFPGQPVFAFDPGVIRQVHPVMQPVKHTDLYP